MLLKPSQWISERPRLTRVNSFLASLLLVLALALAAFAAIPHRVDDMPQEEIIELREEVREMFYHAYNAYMRYAYPKDELKPISCTGRTGKEDNRGTIDDSLGDFSLTLVDSLATLLVLGDVDEFTKSVRRVIDVVNFDKDQSISVFETTIRVLGGLLSSHLLIKERDIIPNYKNELLAKAVDLADRLLPAFETPTGIPYQRVNLKYGRIRGEASFTCTACAGTLVLEFGILSRLTGDTVYEETALKALNSLWTRRSKLSLLGNTIDVVTGQWKDTDSGIGAGIDSFYEYLFKSYLYLDHSAHRDMFNEGLYQIVVRK